MHYKVLCAFCTCTVALYRDFARYAKLARYVAEGAEGKKGHKGVYYKVLFSDNNRWGFFVVQHVTPKY